MEDPKAAICKTCLGPMAFPRNLCDVIYKALLDLLHRILGFQVHIKGEVFTICQSCEGKLNWVLEFKGVCEKSLEKLKNDECKEECISMDEYALCLDNNDFDNDSEFSDSDDDFLIKHARKRKKEVEPSRKIASSKPDKDLKRRSRSKQYPAIEVQQAITESTSYFTDANKRTCIHCDYLATTEKLLRSHMRMNHREFLKAWCCRCNMQTENLVEHKTFVKCSDDRCKFCHKKCSSIIRLTEHLQTHCRDVYKKSIDKNDDFDWDSNLLGQLGGSGNTVKAEVATSEENSSALWINDELFSLDVKNDEKTQNGTAKENDINEKENLHQHRKHTYPQQNYEENEPSSKRVRKDRLQQFPHEEIERAIRETMRPFHTNRQCIICGEITKNSKFLSGHMTKLHRNKRENWCSRCNTVVENITEHKLSHRNDLLKCSFCDRSFHSTIHLKEHLKLHSRSYGLKIETSWFSCKYCPESFCSEKDFKAHRCKPSKDKRKALKKLKRKGKHPKAIGEGGGKRLTQFPADEVQQAINDTMKSFHENRKCIFCGFLARYSRTLSLHVSKLHREMFIRWCSRCNTSVENLPEHKESHKNDVLKCKFCGKSFNTVDHLKDHLKCHCRSYTLDTLPKFFNCKLCPNTYPSEKDLLEHECKGSESQSLAEKKVVQPEVCSVCNTKVKNLKAHVKKMHEPRTGPPPPKGNKLCSVCGKTSSTNYDLQMHMMIHTGEMPHKCSFCDKRFIQRTSLLVHEKRHLGEKPHVCHICGKAFVTTGDLRRHAEVHEGGPVKCTVCDKQFCRPGVLKLHMRRHTGENPFICIECGVSFHRKSLLLRHIKKHSNERLAKCTICEKDFKHKHELKEHERIHKGIKPYKCSQCAFTCEKSCSLILHMKQHPEDSPQASRPHKCLFCFTKYSTNAMLMSHINNKHRDNIVNMMENNLQ